MITHTIGNTVYSYIGVRSIAQYSAKPNQYIHDVTASVAAQPHTEQLVAKGRMEAEKGAEFVDKVDKWSTWYTPPRGGIVDTYA